MGSNASFKLLSLFFALSATTVTVFGDEPVWKNLGLNECLNMQNLYETCGYLQFCSDSNLNKGCRNCSNISDQWCQTDPDTFRQKYPSCQIECAEKKMNILKKNNSALVRQVTDLQDTLSDVKANEGALATCQADLKVKNETLQKLRHDEQLKNIEAMKETSETIQNETQLKWIGIGTSCLLFIILVVVLCDDVSLRKKARRNASDSPHSTASSQNQRLIKKWMTRLLCCLKRPKRPTEEDRPMVTSIQQRSIGLPITETTRVVVNPSDSGQGSEVASDRSNTSSASDVRVVAGGTDHNPSDTKDFMTTQKGAATGEWV
ncbi:uncharacterized protein [Littorina saxatilis]|uniref:Uncharacterized protein n=1 Tax=Littorina saxatilis TaxID=31220 RepID=A0AAN9GP63_9CAEN